MNWDKTKPVELLLTSQVIFEFRVHFHFFFFFFYCLNRFFSASVLVLFPLLIQSPDQSPAGSGAKPGMVLSLLQGCALPCLHSPAHVSVSKVQFMASVVYSSSSFGGGKIP